MTSYNWTIFKKKIFINAKIEDVFKAWVTSEGITKWFIAKADYTDQSNIKREPTKSVQKGDKYLWQWHQDLQMEGSIIEVIDNQLLSFTFGDKEPGSPEKIIVTVDFIENGNDVLLVLTQKNMADNMEAHSKWHLSCNLGWSFFMTNLKAFLEHGIDLREKDPERAYIARAVTHK